MEHRQNFTAEQLLHLQARMEKSGMDETAREQELLRFAGENMNAAQQEKMRSVLQDRQALQKLIQSEQAQTLLNRLRNPS